MRLALAALFVSIVIALQWRIAGFADSFLRQFALELTIWGVWAVWTPVIFRMADRFRIESGRWIRPLLVHVVFGLASILGAIALSELIRIPLGLGTDDYLATVSAGFRAAFGFFLLVYFGIVALRHALAYRSAWTEESARQLRTEAELERARLDAIHAQLQPHFLFNTLNAISSLVTREPENARTMVVHLSDLLRTVLSRSRTARVPLADELRFVQSYLEIQRLRFRDRLEVVIDVQPDALQLMVPPMVLQPLLENALRHGFPARGPARVVLRAQRHEGGLRITVRDNGPGFGAGAVQRGHGIESVESLLSAAHGSGYALRFENHADGASVIVDIAAPSNANDSGRHG